MKANTNKGCLSLLISIFNPSKSVQNEVENLPYKLRSNILSAAEFSFYKVLQDTISNKFEVQCKVRLADIFYTSYGTNISHFNRITGKHVDFLLCNKQTMKPVLGIELDDISHTQPDRKERDIFVDKVFKTAELPLLHIQAKRAYNQGELLTEIKQLIKEEM